jgi:precorrin-2 dehydrogenase/sirohydrochlorin ferrochelatase
MAYYPIFLELTGRPCVVVGGGPVAQRKVDGLLGAGATVTVISSAVTPRLAALTAAGRIRHVARDYRASDLDGQQLAFVATDDGQVNGEVAEEARAKGIWVNAADDPANCAFILPSVLRRGALQVAVATGGASPALSRAIREELEGYFTEDYAALTDLAAEVRRELGGSARRPGPEAWHRALGQADVRRLLGDGCREEARDRLLAHLRATA